MLIIFLLFSANLPDSADASVESLNSYLQALSVDQTLMESDLLSDFLAANWDGKDLNFFISFKDFIDMTTARLKLASYSLYCTFVIVKWYNYSKCMLF